MKVHTGQLFCAEMRQHSYYLLTKNTMYCAISRNTFSAPRTANYVQGINVVMRTEICKEHNLNKTKFWILSAI